ncbi:MAG: hypothetical protein SF002_03040 [Alphaproteobacteria bacterium]|nr:hypothetical protein [Alphaproteobacteria bacterium]
MKPFVAYFMSRYSDIIARSRGVFWTPTISLFLILNISVALASNLNELCEFDPQSYPRLRVDRLLDHVERVGRGSDAPSQYYPSIGGTCASARPPQPSSFATECDVVWPGAVTLASSFVRSASINSTLEGYAEPDRRRTPLLMAPFLAYHAFAIRRNLAHKGHTLVLAGMVIDAERDGLFVHPSELNDRGYDTRLLQRTPLVHYERRVFYSTTRIGMVAIFDANNQPVAFTKRQNLSGGVPGYGGKELHYLSYDFGYRKSLDEPPDAPKVVEWYEDKSRQSGPMPSFILDYENELLVGRFVNIYGEFTDDRSLLLTLQGLEQRRLRAQIEEAIQKNRGRSMQLKVELIQKDRPLQVNRLGQILRPNLIAGDTTKHYCVAIFSKE